MSNMKLQTFSILASLSVLATILHSQTFIWPGQIVEMGAVVGGVSEPATIHHVSSFVSVSVGEITTPHPIYNGWAWVAEVGYNDHLRVALAPINEVWTGTFALPSELLFDKVYYVVIAAGGYVGLDVNDTFVTYESDRFSLKEPQQVPEPVSVALLSALGLLAFVGFRKRLMHQG